MTDQTKPDQSTTIEDEIDQLRTIRDALGIHGDLYMRLNGFYRIGPEETVEPEFGYRDFRSSEFQQPIQKEAADALADLAARQAKSEPQLWQCKSKVLRGFYQSEVVVMANGRDEAIEKALAGFDAYVEEALDQMGSVSFEPYPPEEGADRITIDDFDDPDEKEKMRLRAREAFRDELQEKLAAVQDGFLIQVLS